MIKRILRVGTQSKTLWAINTKMYGLLSPECIFTDIFEGVLDLQKW